MPLLLPVAPNAFGRLAPDRVDAHVSDVEAIRAATLRLAPDRLVLDGDVGRVVASAKTRRRSRHAVSLETTPNESPIDDVHLSRAGEDSVRRVG